MNKVSVLLPNSFKRSWISTAEEVCKLNITPLRCMFAAVQLNATQNVGKLLVADGNQRAKEAFFLVIFKKKMALTLCYISEVS